jgi:NAD(P)-dependent dehydrogenase (short-subunit alcohol dehydrogenase family)
MPSSLPKVLVTGTSSGIGLAIAEHLLTQGHKVVGLDANPSKIKSENFEPITIDLLQQTDVAALLENHTDAQSLVHAAGVLRVAQIGKLSEVDFDLMWRLNVSSVSVIVNLLAPHMAQRAPLLPAAGDGSSGGFNDDKGCTKLTATPARWSGVSPRAASKPKRPAISTSVALASII